jgi:protein-S-isoprenylcysteine O-methyltransferase Ste14
MVAKRYVSTNATEQLMDALRRKAIQGLFQLALILALLLFLPAWTLDYWQAWLFLILFLGASTLISLYVWRKDPKLLARRLNAGPGAEAEPKQKLIQLLASATFIGCTILPALDHRFGWSHVPVVLVLVGDVLIVLGFTIVFLVFKANSFAAATIEIASDQTVISTGPYAVVRHPMYSGALIMLFGTPLALGSWWGLTMFVAITLTIIWRLLDEEEFLVKNLKGYEDYRRKVRYRLVPLVW